MDHLKAGWTPKLICNWLPLTEEQINTALSKKLDKKDTLEFLSWEFQFKAKVENGNLNFFYCTHSQYIDQTSA